MQTSRTATVDLYWIPLGAGGDSVRFNGRAFDAIEAVRRHRRRCDLYHAALVVELNGDRYTRSRLRGRRRGESEGSLRRAPSGVASPAPAHPLNHA
jgi:hypothetical protein